jgi:hypothetical protein
VADIEKTELTNKIYKLLAEGNLPHSDKIKALIPKAGTSNLRYQVWKPVEYTSR